MDILTIACGIAGLLGLCALAVVIGGAQLRGDDAGGFDRPL